MTTAPDRTIARLVLAERDRQQALWGEQNHPDGTGPLEQPLLVDAATGIADDDSAALIRDYLQGRTHARFNGYGDRAGTWADVLLEEVFEALAEDDPERLVLELAQASAVAQAWIGALFRRHPDVAERLLPPRTARNFTPAHLGLVYLLAEQQGATHVRLRRLWDAKAARARSPWPWISDSGLRTRCSELVAWGIVEDTGARGESPTGRPATIWTLTGIHPAKLGRDVDEVPGLDAGVHDRLEALLAEAGDDVLIRSQLELAAEVAGFGITSIDITPDLSGLHR